jgi:hypothetical protein
MVTKKFLSDGLCGLAVRGPGFDSWRFQIFSEVLGLEWSPFSLLSVIEELLGRNSSGFCMANWEYDRGDLLRDILYPQKLTPTSPTRGCC